jgi:hypothetical protein
VAASSGVATFSGLSIDKAGTGYTLTATSGTLTLATSNTFNVTFGAAAKVAFTTQPGGGTGGTAWTTQPAVTVQDAAGNTVTNSSANVTLAITGGTGTAGAALSCTTNPLSASSGVATFTGCSIDKSGNSYTLTATSTGLTQAVSSALNITVGAAAKLAFTGQPGNGTGGSNLSPQPLVAIQDAGGNTVNSTASITLAIGTNPSSGTLSGTKIVAAVAGTATFSGLSIDKAGNGYTLTATSGALTSATSTALNVTVGSAAQLAFTTQPGGGAHTVIWGTQPVVTVQDAGGNTVTSTASVTLAIGPNPPNSGVLSCTTNPKAAVAGVDAFAGCKISKAGVGYTLVATATGLTSATSAAFTIS